MRVGNRPRLDGIRMGDLKMHFLRLIVGGQGVPDQIFRVGGEIAGGVGSTRDGEDLHRPLVHRGILLVGDDF